ncbi:MAG TPA: FMN-dependent NADH-azoreductase [Allosphingosinicella sp.]|nr:FMN-dependent NADH-azoreductase [Allosphingosinicella sp.]
MTKVLVIHSSPRGPVSDSRKLGEHILKRLRTGGGVTEVTVRDLPADPVAHVDAVLVRAMFTPKEAQSEVEAASLRLSDELVDELLAADVLVISVPLYNFSIPSVLKAWIDQIVRPGRTFEYKDTGPNPLVHGKRAYVATTRGGAYIGTPMQSWDHQEPHLRTILGFIGITDVTFVHAEGTVYDADTVSRAEARVDELISAEAA